jgi:predicted phosphatase
MAKKTTEVAPMDSNSIELPTGEGWTITVSDSEGNVVQTFADLTEAMAFAKANGYSLHAE